MQTQSKADAQRRVDQIAHFRKELDTLERDHIVVLDGDQRADLTAYHDSLIARMSSVFDIDSNSREKQLTLGMKIASFIGALGLAASVFFLFYQFWGRFSTPSQVVILILSPLLTLGATLLAAQKETTGYFSKLFGLVSLACFILNLSMLGQIFDIVPSENAFLVWAAFAFILAYAADARLLLAAGILCLAAFLSAKTGTWSGCYWIYFGERPESFFPAAFILFGMSLFRHRAFSGFSEIYRVFGMLLFFIPVLILSNWGAVSYLEFPNGAIEDLYQVVGFVASALAIWLGIRQGWAEVMNTGNVFFTIFLYTKFYDWWWKWMPKYLFFLIIGLTAVLMLLIFKRLRKFAPRRSKGGAA